jgi:tetratricopeptide (TPR) repeat protein
MPRLSASNIPHTSQTDHRIPRNPDLLKSVKPGNEYTLFEETGATFPEIERVRAKGLMKALIAEKQRDRTFAEDAIKLLDQALKSMQDDEVIQQSLGGVLILSGRQQAAEVLSRNMIKQFPLNEVALLRQANGAHDAGHYDEAEEYFALLLELNPWMAVTHGRRAHALGMLNRFDSAFDEAERALKLDPTILPLYGWLAEAYARRGNGEKSQFFKHQSERLYKRLATTKPK